MAYIEKIKITDNTNELKAFLSADSGVPWVVATDKCLTNHTITSYLASRDTEKYTVKTLTDENYLYLATVNSLLTNISMDVFYSPVSKTFIITPDVNYLDLSTDNHMAPELRMLLTGARYEQRLLNEITYTVSLERTGIELPIPDKDISLVNFNVRIMNLPGFFNRYLPNLSTNITENQAFRFDINAIEMLEIDLSTLYTTIPKLHGYRLLNHQLSKMGLVYAGYHQFDKILIPIIY